MHKLFRDIQRTLHILSQRQRRRFWLLVVVGSLLALLEAAGVLSIVPFLAVAINPSIIETNALLKWSYDILDWGSIQTYLLILGGGVLFLLVVRNISGALYFYAGVKYSQGLIFGIAIKLFSSYLRRAYSYFITHDSSRLAKDVLEESREAGLSISSLQKAIADSLTAAALLGMLILFDPLVAVIVVFGLAGIYGIILLTLRRRLVRLGKEQYWLRVRSYKTVNEALANIKNLKTYHCEQLFDSQFHNISGQRRRIQVWLETLGGIPTYVQEIVIIGGLMLVCLLIIATRESFAEILPTVGLYAYAGLRFKPTMSRIFVSLSRWRAKLYSVDNSSRQLESGKLLLRAPQNGAVQRLAFQDRLELRDAVMSYPRSELPALNGASLSLPVHSTIGLVGRTGSGKTTIIDILLGLLELQSGSLQVDNIAIEAENRRCWQANIGYVPQEIILIEATISENIAFGITEQDIDRERVQMVARMAGIGDFIEHELPERYQTQVGGSGIQLSGGQRQRIGIARALYRDPEVLILDEATSALDPATEQIVMGAIRSLERKKTILICTHRISTLRNCDRIYVVEKGRIVADGSYAKLEKYSQDFRTISEAV